MEFTFNFCPTNPKSMCPPNLSVGKEHCKSQAVSNMLKMDQMYVKTQHVLGKNICVIECVLRSQSKPKKAPRLNIYNRSIFKNNYT